MRPLVTSLLLSVVILSGCSIEKIAGDNMVPIFVKIKNEFNKETQTQYAREAGPALLAQLNGFVLSSPDNPDFRLLQAEMNATFSFGFLEKENPDWATEFAIQGCKQVTRYRCPECRDVLAVLSAR